MSCHFNFYDINQYDNYTINLNKNEYKKMENCIELLRNKYSNKIQDLFQKEKNNMSKFEFKTQKNFIIEHKKILLDIINDVLEIYNEELKGLSVVFLSGSFARSTNKMSSDVDLHFFYNHNSYNYIYEEIVSYIISRILKKNRDCIDPTFIFNLQNENKIMITNKMTKSKLRVILKYKNKKIEYSYNPGKKRRFYLQYTNTRDINRLFDYLKNEVIKHNSEWCHCFEIIKGEKLFCQLYDKIYMDEVNFINSSYIKNRINILKKNIKDSNLNFEIHSISQYKDYYQSKTFEWIYEYLSIIRFILIKKNYPIKYLNLLEMYDVIKKDKVIRRSVIIEIYRYMWNLEKLTVYCYENNINYGLHDIDIINYSTKDLDNSLNILKKIIFDDLERLGSFV